MKIKQVIVLRTDLNMRKGKMVAQGAHAAMKVFFDRMVEVGDGHYEIGRQEDWDWEAVKQWVEGPFTKVCVGCPSEADLVALEVQAKEQGLPCALIIDSGKTEFGGLPTRTALAIGPANAEDIDKVTGHLKLL